MKRRCLKQGGREKAFWGAVIPAIASLAGSVYSAISSRDAQQEAMAEQKRQAQEQARRMQLEQSASTLNNYFSTLNQEDRDYEYKQGGKRKLRNGGVKLTDGGPIINLSTGEPVYPGQTVTPGIYYEAGSRHNQTNAQGKKGNGWITPSGKTFETQRKEVDVVTPNEVMVFPDKQSGNGMTYAERAASGENPNTLMEKVLADKRRHLRHGKSTPVEREKALRGATFYTPDYIGLGTNIGASLLSGIWGNAMYNDLLNNIDYELPGFVEEAYVAGPTRVYDDAKKAAIRRNDINTRDNIYENTASGNVALARGQQVGTNSMYELMKVADETLNKNIELRQANAERQQLVRGRNATNRNAWLQKVVDIKNQQLNSKLALGQQKINNNIGMIQGIGSSIGGFLQQGIDNYQADQNISAILAASPYGTAEKLSNMGYKFSKGVMENLRKDAEYNLDKYSTDYTTQGTNEYNSALQRYNYWNNLLGKHNNKYSIRTAKTPEYNRTGIWYNPFTRQGQA